jgi:hypothetical protein
MTRHAGFARFVLIAIVVAAAATAALADSHVRIVRLSSVEGQVQIDRATGEGPERAILNTPIVEGARLVTGSDGLAEVEFENQSALRLTEDTEVKFTQLLMNDAGDKINRMSVSKGLVYLDTASKGDDSYLITVGDKTLVVARNTEARITANPDQVQVAVFKGEVQLEGQGQPVVAKKKETLTVPLTNQADSTVAKGVEDVRFDNWNKEREEYSKAYADNQGYGGPNRGYGLQDLNYYGNFFYAGGYGYVWQPYGFAGSMIGWNPYTNGAWMFYPGLGYTWASAYPWGWLPFHYGSWAFIGGTGWAWVPGRYPGQWYASGFQGVPVIRRAPAGWTAPAPPARLATMRSAPTVVVGKANSQALMIPGGRIPPNFGSVVPGRAVGASTAHGFVNPGAPGSAASHAVFSSPQTRMNAAAHGNPGHVFAPPAARGGFAGGESMHPAYGGSRASGMSIEGMHGTPSMSAAHGSAPSAAGHSGGGHK